MTTRYWGSRCYIRQCAMVAGLQQSLRSRQFVSLHKPTCRIAPGATASQNAGCTVCAFSLARFSPLPTASPSKQIAESVEIVRHTVAPGFGLFGKVNVFVPIDFPSNPLVLDNLWMLLKETAHEFRMFGNVVAFDTSVRSIIGTMSPPQEK